MAEIRFKICDDVWYFNTASRMIERETVQGVRIVATGISTDETGREKLEGDVVLYQTKDGPVLADAEVFSSKEEAIDTLIGVLESLKTDGR